MIRMRGKEEATCRVMFIIPLSECIRHPYTLSRSFFLPPLLICFCLCLSLSVSPLSPSLLLSYVSGSLCLSLPVPLPFSLLLSHLLSLFLSISLSLSFSLSLSPSRDLGSREIVYTCITINQRKARGE